MSGWDGGEGTHGWALIAAKVGKRQYIPTLADKQTDHRLDGREGETERQEQSVLEGVNGGENICLNSDQLSALKGSDNFIR